MTATPGTGLIRHAATIAGLAAFMISHSAAGTSHDERGVGHDSCTNPATLSSRMEFATLPEAKEILGDDDPWARQLSAFDRGIRPKMTPAPDLDEFLDFAADNAIQWTAQERKAWQSVIHDLSKAMAGLQIDLPDVTLVKTTGAEEFGSAYTRGAAINMAQPIASLATEAPDVAFFLLAHELFHVLSRFDTKLRDDMHALLGFMPFHGFRYPLELEPYRLSNPDSFDYGGALVVRTSTGSATVVPLIQSQLALEDAIRLPIVFDAVVIDLVAVDTTTGAVLRDANGDLLIYGFGHTDYVPQMSRNTDFIIQPQEAMADNFALLMQCRATGYLPAGTPTGFAVNDVPLLESVEDRLRGGCHAKARCFHAQD
jgi:hypothetical protein